MTAPGKEKIQDGATNMNGKIKAGIGHPVGESKLENAGKIQENVMTTSTFTIKNKGEFI